MPSRQTANSPPDCSEPEINQLLTAYCFGHATEQERLSVEAHLPVCDYCRNETARLQAAVRVLDTGPGLIQSLPPEDIATAFGVSARLELPWGGHRWHAILSCALYAALYAVALLVEVAYQFDDFGRAGLLVAAAIFVWVLVTSLGGLAADWRLTWIGRGRGLAASMAIFLSAALALWWVAGWFLPAEPVTQMTLQAMPAHGAYLKTIIYFLWLENLFLLIPFHFVLAMQREMGAGRHRFVIGLLTGDKLSVAPRGAAFLRPWMLGLVLAAMGVVAIYLRFNLLNHLKPGAYQNLFTHLIEARLLLYFALGGECLFWYHSALNELKRECLVATNQAR